VTKSGQARPSAQPDPSPGLLEQLVDNAPIGMALFGLDGRITRVNGALCDILGYEENELLGRRFHEITDPDDLSAQLRLVKRLLKGEFRNLQVEERCKHKSGRDLWVRLSMSLAREEDGQPICYFAQIDDITVSRNQAEELARSRASLEALIDHAPVAISLRDLDGRYEVVNHHVYEATGTEPQDLIGRHPVECFSPEAALELTRGDAEVIKTGAAITQERLLPRHDGGSHFYFTVKYPVRDADGRVIGLGSCGVDITARKEAEEQVRARERELAEAQQLAHVGSWDLDPENATVRMTDELRRILGQPLGFEPTYLELLELIHPEDRETVRARAAKVVPGISHELRFRVLRPDGEVRHVQTRYHGRAGIAGRLAHVWGTTQDVTETVARERELQQAKEHADTILSAMSEGYCLTLHGQITAVNDAMTRLTGFPAEELIGARVPYPFWPPELVAEATAMRQRMLDMRGGTFEMRFIRKDGTRFDAEITNRAAKNDDGTMVGFVNTIRDVSDRKRSEDELKRLATHDVLTGLPNHGLFHETLAREVARAVRHRRQLSVAILDLDHFKNVNDRHGHPIGDMVLGRISTLLAEMVRDGEMIARVGGEEFAWILPDSDGADALGAAERVRQAVAAIEFEDVGTVTVSIGVCDLANAKASRELYERADEALYWAKRSGRNRTLRYTPETAREFGS